MVTMTSEVDFIRPEPIRRKIAFNYRVWLRKNPKATHEEKVAKFDQICDELMGR